jgi:hypothetical protein
MFAGYGVAVLWASRDLEGRAGLIRFLLALFFAGGVARALAWFLSGPPHPFFQAMTGLELSLPIILWRVQVMLGQR